LLAASAIFGRDSGVDYRFKAVTFGIASPRENHRLLVPFTAVSNRSRWHGAMGIKPGPLGARDQTFSSATGAA
jgi:hypothetical protein